MKMKKELAGWHLALLKCNNSNSTLAVRSGADLRRLTHFVKKKIEKGLATARIQIWVQMIRSRLC